jgi:hypothetical protein
MLPRLVRWPLSVSAGGGGDDDEEGEVEEEEMESLFLSVLFLLLLRKVFLFLDSLILCCTREAPVEGDALRETRRRPVDWDDGDNDDRGDDGAATGSGQFGSSAPSATWFIVTAPRLLFSPLNKGLIEKAASNCLVERRHNALLRDMVS